MHTSSPRSFIAAVAVGLASAFAFVAPEASAQNKFENAAKTLQKKAMEEDYLATEFLKAQEKLEKAITQCGTDKCSAPVRAALRRDLGVVQIGGQIDRERGISSFVDAIKIDPNVQLEADLRTKELDAAFAEAKKRLSGGGAAAGATGDQPAGDFTHTPVTEQQIRTPIPVYVEYAGDEQLVRVIVRYRGFGMTEWKTTELKKSGDKGWGGLLPCGDVQQGTTQYYVQGFNAANDPVATGGDRNNPYKVTVRREKVAEPPSLPGQPPPTQCADTGDCPPNFPGCKKAAAGGPVATEEPAGKDGGEYCEEDSECRSNQCAGNKCTEPEGKKKAPKVWIGVWGAFEARFLPSADDVCKLRGTNEADPQTPVNDQNYYCTTGADDYPYRITAPGDNNPRRAENTNLLSGASDRVSGGIAPGNFRVMASIDVAVNNNVMVGGRLGYVFSAYPTGRAAKDDGKTSPLGDTHIELRGTYLFGKDALLKKLAPYAMAGFGIATWDAAVKVSVDERAPGGPTVRKEVDAWHIAGPYFLTAGGGARLAFSPRAALMGGARVNLSVGNATAFSVGPELGILMGF